MSTHDPDSLRKMQEHDRSRRADDLSKKILAAVNSSYMGEQTMAWLRNVNENVAVSRTGEHSIPAVGTVSMTMVSIVDKLFDEFQRYAYQFNQTESNREFVVTCKRPSGMDQGQSSNRYQGFVQNSRWAMMVRGEPKAITLTFVSPRFLYEDESRRPIIPPFLELTSADGSSWKLGAKTIYFEHLPGISKRVFARLIRVSRSEVSETDRMSIDLDEPEIPEAVPSMLETTSAARADMITECIMTLLEVVDSELKYLQDSGMALMKGGDVNAMQSAVKRSNDLTKLRANAAMLAKQWAELLAN